jgi:hypothetical protein
MKMIPSLSFLSIIYGVVASRPLAQHGPAVPNCPSGDPVVCFTVPNACGIFWEKYDDQHGAICNYRGAVGSGCMPVTACIPQAPYNTSLLHKGLPGLRGSQGGLLHTNLSNRSSVSGATLL